MSLLLRKFRDAFQSSLDGAGMRLIIYDKTSGGWIDDTRREFHDTEKFSIGGQRYGAVKSFL